MFRRDASVDAGIDNLAITGPEMVDDLSSYFRTEKLLGDDAAPDGLAPSLVYGRQGEQIDAIGPYQPGIDAPRNLDLNATLASGRDYAKKVLTVGSPHRIHVVLDAPERTAYLEGLHSFSGIGNYALALSAVVAEAVDDAELRIYHAKEPDSSGLVFDGDADNIDLAYSRIEELEKAGSNQHGLASLLATLVGEVDPENDATVLVSDFMDGYDLGTGEFDWEAKLTEAAFTQEDLMRIARITSPSHRRIPHGVIESADSLTLRNMNENYLATAIVKERRIRAVIDGLLAKSVTIGTDSHRPTEGIMNLLRGSTEG